MKDPDLITFHTEVELTPQQIAEELAASPHTPRGTYEVSVSKMEGQTKTTYHYQAKRVRLKPVLAYSNGVSIV